MRSSGSAALVAALFTLAAIASGQDCIEVDFGDESFVCACSGTECDFPGDIAPPADTSTFTLVSTARDSGRFAVASGVTEAERTANTTTILINTEYEYQTMLGFGGAFTDATGINIVSLSPESQDTLIRSYFAPEGIRYDLCRIPIAGSDFSTHPYSYDDVEGDVDLEFFALAEEDFLYKLPLIARAMEVKGEERELLLFGSPWSPPAWMKENGMFNESGGLLPEMWGPYSNYLVRFLEEYAAEGAPMWGITTQNEPLTGFDPDYPFNTCAWSAEDMRDWIVDNLGPTLDAAGYEALQIMVFDHNRYALVDYVKTILENPAANAYVDGVAVHWYDDFGYPPSLLNDVHDMFPDKFILYTEACEGAGWPPQQQGNVILGSWLRAENYALSILQDVTHHSTGWVDWNMALDMEGGPNWVDNFVDSPIIIDAATDTFYKQPMFYVMGHFSKFILPGAKAVYSSVTGNSESIQAAAFVNPDGVGVAVILNLADEQVEVTIEPNPLVANYLNVLAPAKSIHTVLFNIPAPASTT